MVRCGGVAWHGMARRIVQWGVVEGSTNQGVVQLRCRVPWCGVVLCSVDQLWQHP